MKKKKLLAVPLAMLVLLSPLGATSIDEIIEGAKGVSPSFKNTVITYQNGLMNVQKLEKADDQVVVTVTGTDGDRITPSDNGAALYMDNELVTVSPSVSVTLPNDGSTTFTGSLGVTSRYDGAAKSIYGGVGVTHTIDLIGYESNADDLSYTKAKFSTELTYRRAELNFEKTVLSTVSSLLSSEKNIVNTRRNVEKQEKSLENMKALGTYSASSPTLIKAENSLATLKSTLEAYEKSFADALENYRVLTGLEWDYLDELPLPELNLTTYEAGNTSVMLTSISAQSALDKYLKTLSYYNPNVIKLSGNASSWDDFEGSSNYNVIGSASYTSDKWTAALTPSVKHVENTTGMDSTTWKIEGSATYNEDNWNIKVAPTFSYTQSAVSDPSWTPTVTVSGKWTNATVNYDAQDLELQTLKNDAQSAENDYVSALSSYTQEAQNYAVKILEWNYKKVQAEANMAYLQMILENQQSLFDMGLVTKDSVEDAEMELLQAKYDWNIMVLSGLSLQRELEIFAL